MAPETMAAVLLTEHGDVDALDYRTTFRSRSQLLTRFVFGSMRVD